MQVDRHGDVCCVRLLKSQMEELEVHELADDILDLIDTHACRKLVIDFSSSAPQCLYSVFLAKLVTIRRHVLERGGVLKLCDATPEVLSVFDACQLRQFFEFHPSAEAALEAFGERQA
jgi:anti-anti-sigma factor